MNKKISVTQKSEGREFIVSAEIISLGGDLLLVITGGKAHIGSVSISQYHKDKNDPNRMTTTTSTIAVLGEKEEIITRDIAAFVSEKTAKNTAVINALTPLSNARIARNNLLYNTGTGLVDLAGEVKKYVKSVFGTTSPQYKQVSGLKFTKRPS